MPSGLGMEGSQRFGCRGQPEVRVSQAAFCVVPMAAARAVTGPMRGADEVHT